MNEYESPIREVTRRGCHDKGEEAVNGLALPSTILPCIAITIPSPLPTRAVKNRCAGEIFLPRARQELYPARDSELADSALDVRGSELFDKIRPYDGVAECKGTSVTHQPRSTAAKRQK